VPGRFDVLREIERLDPERDHQRIVHLSFGYEFPWDSIRALEIALYRTYCVPSISALLDRTGEFRERTQQRYDDTSLIVAEMCKWGYESGRGREALERMNWAHGHFTIANDDFLYVLSTFIYEPVRWIDRFGWRQTVLNERLGYYWFWRAVGTRMGIRNIPGSYEAFEAWAAPTSARSSGSRTAITAWARPPAICLPRGSRASSPRSSATASTRCWTTRCLPPSVSRSRCR
jgi:hypothetical protein